MGDELLFVVGPSAHRWSVRRGTRRMTFERDIPGSRCHVMRSTRGFGLPSPAQSIFISNNLLDSLAQVLS